MTSPPPGRCAGSGWTPPTATWSATRTGWRGCGGGPAGAKLRPGRAGTAGAARAVAGTRDPGAFGRVLAGLGIPGAGPAGRCGPVLGGDDPGPRHARRSVPGRADHEPLADRHADG